MDDCKRMSARASSACPQCFTGNCRVHPNQDGGKQTAELLEKLGDKAALQKRLYDSVVKKQLEKLSKEEGRTKSAENSDAYRADLDKERRRAEKRKNRLTPEQQAKAKSIKLGGHLLEMMLEGSDSEGGGIGSDGDAEKRKKRKRKVIIITVLIALTHSVLYVHPTHVFIVLIYFAFTSLKGQEAKEEGEKAQKGTKETEKGC